MSDVQFTSFDGVGVNGNNALYLLTRKGKASQDTVSVKSTTRRDTGAVYDSMTWNQRTLELTVMPNPNEVADVGEWKEDIEGLFQVWTSDETRRLEGTLHDGTLVFLDVRVISRTKEIDTGSVYGVVWNYKMTADYPLWRKVAQSSSTGDVTNIGNAQANPVIEFTTATHKILYACDVSGTGAGGGLPAYPVRFAYTQSNLVAGEVFAYVNGVNTPTYSDNYNAYVWTLLDTSQDANIPTSVDLVMIDGVNVVNPLGGRLEQGGMKLGDAVTGTDATNTSWSWNDFQISQNPIRCGSWRPGITGNDRQGSFEIGTETSSTLMFRAYANNDDLQRDADSMVLFIGSQGNSLAGLSRVTTEHNAGGGSSTIRSYAKVRAFNSAQWSIVWSVITDTTVTSSISLANTIEVAVGCEVYANTGFAYNGTLTITMTGTTFTLSLNSTPTVNVPAAQNLDYYHGTFVNDTTGEYIDFRDFVVLDGTLYVDTFNHEVYSSVGVSPYIYGEIRLTDAENWFRLDPGLNTIDNNVTGASYTIEWNESYV